MNQPLLAEDGAIFLATIQEADNGQFQATCYAQLDNLSHVLSESPDYHIADTKEQAKVWVHSKAAARGFPSVYWERAA